MTPSESQHGPTVCKLSDEQRFRRWCKISLVTFGVFLFTIRLTGLPNFNDNERRLTSYILDAIHNGNWFVQTDATLEVASKPPLLTWLASLAVLPTGEVTRFALYWPSAFATIAIALILFTAGTRLFGTREGLFAAATYLMSYAAYEQMEMPRYDGLLALFTTLGALAAFEAWESGKGWTRFWVVNALGTLVKGPVVLLVSSCGLLSRVREWRQCRVSRKFLLGVLIYLGITTTWLGLAYWQMGPALIDKMIHRELIGHAVSGYKVGRDWTSYLEPFWNFIRTFAPWSLLTLLALAGSIRPRSLEPSKSERFERFLAAWLLAGLLIFVIGSHQRARLIVPVLPPAALLAGLALTRFTARIPTIPLAKFTATAAALFLFGAILHSHFLLQRSRRSQETLAAIQLVDKLEELQNAEFPFTYLDLWYPLQVAASTRANPVSRNEALERLSNDSPAFVVARAAHSDLTNECSQKVFTVFKWPEANPKFVILSNHPRLEWTKSSDVAFDGLNVEMTNAVLVRASEDRVTLDPTGENVEVTISNDGETERELILDLEDEAHDIEVALAIPPHSSRTVKYP